MFHSLVTYLQHSLIMCIDTLQCQRFHLSICDKSASLRIARPWVRWPDWPRLVAPTHDWMVRVAPAFGVLDGFFCFQFVGWRDWRCWIVGLPGVLWLVMKWHERNKLRSSWSNYMGVSKNNGTPKSSILIGFSIINHPFWGETPIYVLVWLFKRHCWVTEDCESLSAWVQWNQSGGVSFLLV